MTDTQYIFIVVIINRFGSCQSMMLHSEHLNTHIHEHVHDIQYEWLSWYTDSIHIPTYNKYYVDSDFIVVQLIVQPCVLQPPAIIYVGYHLSLLVFPLFSIDMVGGLNLKNSSNDDHDRHLKWQRQNKSTKTKFWSCLLISFDI
jgi:hypothetical protein